MTEYLAPGVYVEEVAFRSTPIEGVPTSTAGFITASTRAPLAGPLSSFADVERAVRADVGETFLLSIRGFFENGGKRCYVAAIAPGGPFEPALDALAAAPVSLVCCPDQNALPGVVAALVAHCERLRYRFAILDSPGPMIPAAAHEAPVDSSCAAYYHPWLRVASLDGTGTVTIPPAGHVAGVYAATDISRGAWRAPAGVPLLGVQALSEDIDAGQAERLVQRGINVIRNLPGHGVQVWSARTTGRRDAQWKYVNVRRLFMYIAQSIDEGLQWAVYEPNGAALWLAVRSSIANFLNALWREGALKGDQPDEAYQVHCDRTTMSQSDIDNGRLVVVIGIAPVRPAEFVIVRILCQTKPCTPA